MGLEGTGKRYSIDEIHIFRIREGQVVEHWHAFDTMDLMRQLKGEGAASKAQAGESSSAR
jgi:predicted ester cyclase